MIEIWKDIPNYEGLYQVSNLGNVKSLDHYSSNGFTDILYKGRLLKQQKDKYGYLSVVLYKNGKYKRCKVHRLVALAFIENLYDMTEINHIDGNKKNNNVSNLEYSTRSLNNKHAYSIGLKSPKLGTDNNLSKGIEQLDLNYRLIATWSSARDIARVLNIDDSSVIKCCKGKRKTTGGYLWRYANE